MILLKSYYLVKDKDCNLIYLNIYLLNYINTVLEFPCLKQYQINYCLDQYKLFAMFSSNNVRRKKKEIYMQLQLIKNQDL